MNDRVIKNLGEMDISVIECFNTENHKLCHICLSNNVCLRERCDVAEIFDVDSVVTDNEKTQILIFDTLYCRIEYGDGITNNPDKKYLICAKEE